MNRSVRTIAPASLFLLIFYSHILFSQSQNEGQKWLLTGYSETDPQKKIAAFRKAIELDPAAIEAYLNLGIELRKTGEHGNAEKALRKAYSLGLTGIGERLKSHILSELAKTYLLRNDLLAAEEALRSAKNLAQDDKFKSRISLQLAEVYFLQEQYQKAQTELAVTNGTVTTEATHRTELLEAVNQAVEMDRLYEAALTASRDGNSRQAKMLLLQINERSPGFKDVEQRLVELEIQLSRKAGIGSFDDNGQPESIRAVNITNSRKDVRANKQTLPEGNANLKQDPDRVAAFAKRTKPEKTDLEKKPVGNTKNNLIAEPSEKSNPPLTKTETPKPETRVRSSLIDSLRDSRTDSKRHALKRNPTLESGDTPKSFEEEITTMLTVSEDQDTYISKKPDGSNGLLPWDKSNSNRGINNKNAADKKVTSKLLVMSGILISAVMLVFAVYGFFVPRGKATFFKLSNKPNKSAEIYEKLLEKHPDKLWLYPALAKLYDQMGRRDSRAIAVYKMIQHLNLRAEEGNLRAVVAYKYLQNNEKEAVTVEVLDANNS